MQHRDRKSGWNRNRVIAAREAMTPSNEPPTARIVATANATSITYDSSTSTGVVSFEWSASSTNPLIDLSSYFPDSVNISRTVLGNDIFGVLSVTTMTLTLSINGGESTAVKYIDREVWAGEITVFDAISGTFTLGTIHEDGFDFSDVPHANYYVHNHEADYTGTGGGLYSGSTGTVTGLNAGTLYRMSIQAALADGTPTAADGTFTDVLTLPASPENFAITNVIDNGDGTYNVDISWSANSGEVTSYSWGQNGGPSSGSGLFTSATLANCVPGNNLYVRASNNSGDGAESTLSFSP